MLLCIPLEALAAEAPLDEPFAGAPLAVVRTQAEGGDAAAQLELASRLTEGLLMRPLCPGEPLTITVTDASPETVMAIFSQVSGFPILGLEKETRPVSIKVNDVSWETALTEALKSLGYSWMREGNAIRATPLARSAS